MLSNIVSMPCSILSPGRKRQIVSVLCADAKWLQTEFFKRYATELAQPGIKMTVPADTLFLTPPMLDKISWASQLSCGSAWQQAVTAALMPENMTLDTRYAALKHRFPQIMTAAGVTKAGKPQPAHASDDCLYNSTFIPIVVTAYVQLAPRAVSGTQDELSTLTAWV